MKISVITVVFNNERTIKSTIDSVIGQSYPEVEYIVIDGGSTDKTIDIIRSYGKKVSKLISEKDEGIYDAMNKGIKAAEGDVICFLNSDDFYVDNQVLEKVAGIFNTKKVD
ncbi:MAG: glycosyltransferase, partial [Candidatus Omnitrophica bacterium]|nr:glycosyltransferase [Candidatus Omnitrophota bacterium]